jgi:hypothetical protein
VIPVPRPGARSARRGDGLVAPIPVATVPSPPAAQLGVPGRRPYQGSADQYEALQGIPTRDADVAAWETASTSSSCDDPLCALSHTPAHPCGQFVRPLSSSP